MATVNRFLTANVSTLPTDPGYWAKFLTENGPYVTCTILLFLLIAVIGLGGLKEWWVWGSTHRRALAQIEADLEIRKLREKDSIEEIKDAFEEVKAESARREEASQRREEALQQRVDQLTEIIRNMDGKLEGIKYAIRDDRGGARNGNTG